MVEQNNFNRRLSISRREPVIALERLRIRGRNFEEGAYLDRRRTHMRNAHLAKLIREGVCILARDMAKKDLLKLGWVYDAHSPRMKLISIDKGTALAMRNQAAMDKLMAGENDETDEPGGLPTAELYKNGWYKVILDGKDIGGKSMREVDAQEFVKNYKGVTDE